VARKLSLALALVILLTLAMAAVGNARGLKNCGTRAPFQNPTRARGVGCSKARAVVQKWSHKTRSTCALDGTSCQVMRFTCSVPAANNYSNLVCHRGRAVIFQHLVY